jgi:hypothetical protein
MSRFADFNNPVAKSYDAFVDSRAATAKSLLDIYNSRQQQKANGRDTTQMAIVAGIERMRESDPSDVMNQFCDACLALARSRGLIE